MRRNERRLTPKTQPNRAAAGSKDPHRLPKALLYFGDNDAALSTSEAGEGAFEAIIKQARAKIHAEGVA